MKKKVLITVLSLATLLFVSCASSIEKTEAGGKKANTETVTNNSNNGENKEETDKTNTEKVTIDFYVPNDNADGFDIVQKEYEEIDLVKIVQDFISDSDFSYNNAKVLGIEVKDGVAYVDLSSEFFDDNNSNSSAGARAKVYSIVNTLCYNESLDIQEVTFLKEGVAPETIGPLSNGIFQPKEEI